MRKIVTVRSSSARDNQTHGLRKWVFRMVLVGPTLRDSNMAVCVCATEVVAHRSVAGIVPTTRTRELTRFRDSRFDSQPAEYSAHTREGAIAQFLRDFPKMKVMEG